MPADPKLVEPSELPPPPPALPALQQDIEVAGMLAGVHRGVPYLSDVHDRLRLYPGGRLRTDLQYAPGAPDLPGFGAALGPRFFVRRVRLDLSGDIYGRLAFSLGGELGSERIGETSFTGPDTPRFAQSSAHDSSFRPVDVAVSYRLRRWLSFTLGQQNTPFSLSNRTPEPAVSTMERPLAIRGFAVPDERALGLALWGDVSDLVSYELGVFDGDGEHGPFADTTPDFAARAIVRPLRRIGKSRVLRDSQVGVSGRIGGRDMVSYDYPTLATGGGYVMWQPGYVDSQGRVTHVLPSGMQRAVGGELRAPFDLPGGRGGELRAEAYFVENDTREAVEGFIATNSERFGRVRGLGWYAQASLWALGDAFANGEPGTWRPKQIDREDDAPLPRGLEVVLLASGINASYSAATREGSTEDALTPRSNITTYQLGGAFNYWRGTLFRASLEYFAYLAPGSGTAANLAVLPSEPSSAAATGTAGDEGGASVHHELSGRVAVSF